MHRLFACPKLAAWHMPISVAAVDQLLVCCFMQSGQGLLLSALQHISAEGPDTSVASRIGVIHNPRDASQEPSLLARLLLATTQLTSRRTKIAGEEVRNICIA